MLHFNVYIEMVILYVKSCRFDSSFFMEGNMNKNSSQYFENRECEYYPCHTREDGLNCLFCYCPLYSMPTCPGEYSYIVANGKRIKSCENCTYPHKRENYAAIIRILENNVETGEKVYEKMEK